ncbi:P-loop containing nucleoside triphosphate hydrolase protein [Rhodocollybia butyracea]|uniref:P-loop containing nucleoside triphosphate hydrolase protein n=1 Tax=Rhodocollybia butyracea TaxID=206335 RepID=A0A9P5Q4N7_9AGAR|nr:P-loop containing nucleoside triphosphate hydrolase protein [Rhodocollybia butyracea]
MASFSLGPGLHLPEHKFANGTRVLLSRIDPLKEEPSHRSFELDLPSHTSDSSGWRLDLTQSDYVFELMRKSIDSFASDVQDQEDAGIFLPPPVPGRYANQREREYILDGTHLRNILLRSFEPSEGLQAHTALQEPDDVDYVERNVLEHGYLPEHISSSPSKSLPTAGFRVEDEKSSPGFAALDGNNGVFSDNMLIHSWATRYSNPNPVVIEGDPEFKELDRMNESQKRAMAMMIGQKISLIQGVSTFLVDFIFPSNHAKQPPGTGKTLTIISTVKLLKIIFRVPQPLLVCTYTNVAVDNLVEGLAKAGLKPLRAASTAGAGKSINSADPSRANLNQWTLEYQLQHHPRYPEYLELEKRAKKITDDIKELHGKIRKLAEAKGKILSQREVEMRNRMLDDVAQKGRALGAVKKKSYGLEQEITREIVNNADVICTTCITSASAALNIVDFPVVFLDEASMSTEPASLIPLMKGSRHLALIGDHKQLPPVITSPEAQSKGLAISLFERLTLEGVVPSTMLNTQYRMHPAISHFPSLEFYNSSLLDGTADTFGNVTSRLMPPNISPTLLPPSILANGLTDLREKLADGEVRTSTRPSVIFLDHSGTESAKSKSRVNWSEAHIVASVVEDLLLKNDNLRGQDIGIIAPYVAQISLLTKLFNTDPKYRQRFNAVLGEHRAMQLTNIEIKTVDGFEGREKEVIIFSTVRNNSGGYIGFLADRRRLNVGLTRAKRGLFVVGSMNTLQQGKSARSSDGVARVGKGAESWRRYMEYVVDQGLVLKLHPGTEALANVLYGNINNVNGVLTPSSSLPIAASLRS